MKDMGETQKKVFDYFRAYEAEQFSFYRIPKVLFTDEYFQDLSTDAKVLYGLMLDRMVLSKRNRWFDEEGRVYIIFTVEGCHLYELWSGKEYEAFSGTGYEERDRVN